MDFFLHSADMFRFYFEVLRTCNEQQKKATHTRTKSVVKSWKCFGLVGVKILKFKLFFHAKSKYISEAKINDEQKKKPWTVMALPNILQLFWLSVELCRFYFVFEFRFFLQIILHYEQCIQQLIS